MADKDEALPEGRTERNAATSFRDNHGGPPSEAPANNGRPNDLEIREYNPVLPNSTLATRAKRAAERGKKQVAEAEDKAVTRRSRKG